MPVEKIINKAFTLIELLVVIAIIALLLSIVLPSLKLSKDMARRTVCLAHLHSLGLSWLLYADENGDLICNAKTARITEVSSNPREFIMNWSPDAYHNEPTWVGWFDEPIADGVFAVDEVARQACVTMGSLFPYNESLDIYLCPAGREKEVRMFSITDAMNGHTGFEPAGKVIRKTSMLRSPGTRLVFLDEGWATTESWTIYPDRIEWWDWVPLRHGEGTTVVMADGTAEYWKWSNQKTIDFGNGLIDAISSAQDNEDFLKIQRAAWGSTAH